MRKLVPTPLARVFLPIALALAGCRGEERGPVLLGGREARSWLADLHDRRPQVRRQAVLKLSNVADADPAVAEGLIGALSDPDALVRRDAVVAVTRLKDPPVSVWDRLEAMSRSDKDARARELAGKVVARRRGAG